MVGHGAWEVAKCPKQGGGKGGGREQRKGGKAGKGGKGGKGGKTPWK